MYKHDAITQRIINFLRDRPRRLYELQHEIGQLSAFGLIHKMNVLEIRGVVFAERVPAHKSTIYYLLPEQENENGNGETSPSKEDTATCLNKG
jgi:DNA-binding HxlR family transcriptional regulator